MLQFEPGLMIWTSISFVMLLIVLYKALLPPLLQVMEKREKAIAVSLEKAEQVNKDAERFLSEYKKKMEDSHIAASQIVERSREEARLIINEAVGLAKKESKSIIEQTKLEIDANRREMIDEVKRASADLIVLAASKVLEREIGKEDNLRVIMESLNGPSEL